MRSVFNKSVKVMSSINAFVYCCHMVMYYVEAVVWCLIVMFGC